MNQRIQTMMNYKNELLIVMHKHNRLEKNPNFRLKIPSRKLKTNICLIARIRFAEKKFSYALIPYS